MEGRLNDGGHCPVDFKKSSNFFKLLGLSKGIF